MNAAKKIKNYRETRMVGCVDSAHRIHLSHTGVNLRLYIRLEPWGGRRCRDFLFIQLSKRQLGSTRDHMNFVFNLAENHILHDYMVLYIYIYRICKIKNKVKLPNRSTGKNYWFRNSKRKFKTLCRILYALRHSVSRSHPFTINLQLTLYIFDVYRYAPADALLLRLRCGFPKGKHKFDRDDDAKLLELCVREQEIGSKNTDLTDDDDDRRLVCSVWFFIWCVFVGIFVKRAQFRVEPLRSYVFTADGFPTYEHTADGLRCQGRCLCVDVCYFRVEK